MLTKDEMAIFEQAVREVIEEQQKKIGLSDESVGKMAFSFMPFPRMKVQAIKRGQGKAGQRQPQQLRWADMINLCESVGLSWVDVGRGVEGGQGGGEVGYGHKISTRNWFHSSV